MSRQSNRLFLAATLMVLSALIFFVGAHFAHFAFTPAQSGASTPVIIEVHRGQPRGELAKLLASQGVVSDSQYLLWLGRLTRQWKKVKAGEYQVTASMSPLEILATLTSGVSISHPVTVREGENMYEIASDLANKKLADKNRFLALCRDPKFMQSLGFRPPLPPSLEGYLYPETYFFNRTLTPEDMIRQMVRRFHATWGEAERAAAGALNLTQHQIVTLASIIEKETAAPSERPMISAVFHNRLQKRMRLQSDPTSIYGVWETYKGNIQKQDLLARNEYNTYVIPALPVGPIGNPGKEAIQAALHPAQADYLFFVSHNDGTHEFTRTYEEHLHAVRKFQLDPKAREGKSWRDLKKSPASVPSS